MAITRRDVLRLVGVAVLDLALSRCAPSRPDDHPSRTRLRTCWRRLAQLGQEDAEDIERVRGDLVNDHRAALDDLVAAGELDARVADQIQVAFSEAAFHIWRSKAPITCYIVYPLEAVARDDILNQLEVLHEVSDGLDPRAVRQVEAAMAQDIALLDAASAGEMGADLVQQFKAHDIEVDRETIEASRFLVDLMTTPGGP